MLLPDFDTSILRAADIRGIAGKNLTSRTACLIGQGFGTILYKLNKKQVYVGRDGRISSPEISQALIDGLVLCGLKVIDLGVCPTPMVYFATKTTDVDCGVMVTASHNPPEYNGFKLILNRELFAGSQLQDLGRQIERNHFHVGKGSVEKVDLKASYIQRILQGYKAGSKKLKIVWDCSNGAAGVIVPELIKYIQGQHIVINQELDGTFPNHVPDASDPAELTKTMECVVQNQADLGIVFDGDADRLGVIDRQGHYIATDIILPILAEPILKNKKGVSVVADVKCSSVFSKEIEKMGGMPIVTKTGHFFIKGKMKEVDAVLGGEKSGHICFKDGYYGYDDGLYACLRLLSIVEDIDFSERLSEIPVSFLSPEFKFFVKEHEKTEKIEKAKKILLKNEIPFDCTDGIRVFNKEKNWWLLRSSNTIPALVGCCEADTYDKMKELEQNLKEFVEQL